MYGTYREQEKYTLISFNISLISVLTLYYPNFDVWLTVHLSIFILVINQLDAQNFVL